MASDASGPAGGWWMDGTDRGVITLGFGPEKYKRMATALARSIRLHDPELPLAVVTDDLDHPDLQANFDKLIAMDPAYGTGVQQKLSLDRYSPFGHTVFIDADCLVVRSLEPVFGLLGVVPFGVVGFPVIDGFYWAEVTELMRRFEVPYIGRFNAGVISFHGPEGTAVFETARRYVAEDKLAGLPMYRGAPHDEIPMSAALGHLGLVPIYDDGRIMRAPEPLQSRISIDVANGVGRFKTKNLWVEPAVMHFAYLFHGPGLRGSIYRREVAKLLGEPVPLGLRLRCAASQAIFTLESSTRVRTAWKRSRGSIRRTIKRALRRGP